MKKIVDLRARGGSQVLDDYALVQRLVAWDRNHLVALVHDEGSGETFVVAPWNYNVVKHVVKSSTPEKPPVVFNSVEVFRSGGELLVFRARAKGGSRYYCFDFKFARGESIGFDVREGPCG